MIPLVEGGEVFAPEPLGRASVLVLDQRIARVGDVDRPALEALQVELEVIAARGAIVVPGDPARPERRTGGLALSWRASA